MTDKEIDQAMGALINWFQSQDIGPRDGGLIMTRLMAAQFVLKTRDANELQDALYLFSAGLRIMLAEIEGLKWIRLNSLKKRPAITRLLFHFR
jgi:hypothetical protein